MTSFKMGQCLPYLIMLIMLMNAVSYHLHVPVVYMYRKTEYGLGWDDNVVNLTSPCPFFSLQ
jgi:hypothetical protein